MRLIIIWLKSFSLPILLLLYKLRLVNGDGVDTWFSDK